MSEVTIEINGRKYRMACEDGQESQLVQVGERFDNFVATFKNEFGEIGDNRLIVMAGIAAVDALFEAEETIEKLKRELDLLKNESEEIGGEQNRLKEKYISNINEAAQRIEQVAISLEKSANN